jgi:hypothetical protein
VDALSAGMVVASGTGSSTLVGATIVDVALTLVAGVECGDGTCSGGENRCSCIDDCPRECGDGCCSAPQEDPENCSVDC